MVVGDILSREKVWRLLNPWGDAHNGKMMQEEKLLFHHFFELTVQFIVFSRISGTTKSTWEKWSWTANTLYWVAWTYQRQRQWFRLAGDFPVDQIWRKRRPGKPPSLCWWTNCWFKGGSRWSKAHVGTISISVMKKVRSMLDHAHFFFDEEGTNLHDIIEHDAEKIFPCDDTKVSLFRNTWFKNKLIKVFMQFSLRNVALNVFLKLFYSHTCCLNSFLIDVTSTWRNTIWIRKRR